MSDIHILTSSRGHPIYPHIKKWAAEHDASLFLDKSDCTGGEFLFLISCGDIIGSKIRDLYDHTLVVHASDLPKGRGWSPHIWQILEGRDDITLSLLEAEDRVDTGRIWAQEIMHFEGHELYDEINAILFKTTFSLMEKAVKDKHTIEPRDQSGAESIYPKRTPKDSEVQSSQSLDEIFPLLRTADPNRFPAFFEKNGYRYAIEIKKIEKKQ